MRGRSFLHRVSASAVIFAVLALAVAAPAQTRIDPPKNKYRVSEDVKLGNDAARQVENQFPLINDADAEDYIQRVGQRLAAAIPEQYSHPEFNYRFRWVNASDLNAFALPGGPMYVCRGMIQQARNEGEMAGVMAHEISHVALRHATAQATEQGRAKNTLGTIGLILGGAILGGQTGAQLGAMGAAAWMTKYSRKYESQADLLGAQIMARAGYDPRDLANVFQTIAAQGGNGGPEWLSSHPDPGNRYQAINREAQNLNVSRNPIKITRDFERVQARFRSMPPARSMSQIEKAGGGGGNDPGSGGRYSSRVEAPSSRTRTYTAGNVVQLSVPDNWREFGGNSDVTFAPEGAYGSDGITHGMMVGATQGSGNLQQDAQDYLRNVLNGNNYLRQQGSVNRTTIGGRSGYVATLAGRSPITQRTEVVTVYMAQTRSGQFVFFNTVVPQDESYNYSSAFRSVLNSVRWGD
jgi:predicted Zn-dependent protease